MKKVSPNVAKSWRVAPMPKFMDREFAEVMTHEGYYRTVEDAHIDVEPGLKDRVRARCAEYLENYRYPLCWQAAQMPGRT